MRLKDLGEVLFLDQPRYQEITKTTVQKIIDYARRYFTGDARVAMGRVYTDAEFEARQKRSLSRSLP